MRLKLRSLILLLLLPALLVQVLIIARWNYTDLRAAIMRGFDQKLLAISTVTASLVDGDKQDQFLELVQGRGAAFNPATSQLYVSYYMQPEIAVLNKRGQKLRTMSIEGDYYLEDIGYSSRLGKIIGYDLEARELIAISPNSGKTTVIVENSRFENLEDDCYAIAEHKGNLYCTGNNILYKINPKENSIVKHTNLFQNKEPYEGEIRGLSPSAANDELYAYDTGTLKLLTLNLKTGEVTEKKTTLYVDDQLKTPDYLTRMALGLAYNPSDQKLYAGSTMPLLEIDLNKSAVYPMKVNFQGKTGLIYDRHLRSLLQIKINRDITYLGLGKVTERGKKLVYILDPEQLLIMAPIGYQDADDIDEEIADVFFKGKTFLSEPTFWEEWGWLKTGYAPVTDQADNIRAITFADIGISIIDEKTAEAQVRIFTTGLLLFIISIIAGLFITRRLIKPIGQLKEVALKVAAGMYDQQITIKEPKELEELSNAFNDLSNSLQQTLEELYISNKKIADLRNRSEIERLIEQKFSSEYFHQKESSTYGGSIDIDQSTILWMTNKQDSFDAAKLNLAIGFLAEKAAEADNKVVASNLLEIYQPQLDCLLEIKRSKGKHTVTSLFGECLVNGKSISENQKVKGPITLLSNNREIIFVETKK